MHRKPTALWADSHRHHIAAFHVSAEQYSMGAAFETFKITLLGTIRRKIQNPLYVMFACLLLMSDGPTDCSETNRATWPHRDLDEI